MELEKNEPVKNAEPTEMTTRYSVMEYDNTKPEDERVSEIKCLGCSKTYTTDNLLNLHYERNPVCKMWLSVKTPKVEVDPEPECITKCDGCGDIFRTKKSLETHHLHHPICLKWMSIEKYSMEKYTEHHTFECEACNNKYTTKYSLERHQERSPVCKQWFSLEKPVKCHICIVDFIESLKNKVLTHVDNPLTCKYCNIVYSSVGNLNKHYKHATACNRLAYSTLLQEIKELN